MLAWFVGDINLRCFKMMLHERLEVYETSTLMLRPTNWKVHKLDQL